MEYVLWRSASSIDSMDREYGLVWTVFCRVDSVLTSSAIDRGLGSIWLSVTQLECKKRTDLLKLIQGEFLFKHYIQGTENAL